MPSREEILTFFYDVQHRQSIYSVDSHIKQIELWLAEARLAQHASDLHGGTSMEMSCGLCYRLVAQLRAEVKG